MALPPQYSEGLVEGIQGNRNAGNIQVHTREDSGNSLEEMFRVVTNPSSNSSVKPLKDRKLPRSFFEPSPPHISFSQVTPPAKVGTISKSSSIASSISPNIDLSLDQAEYTATQSCGSDAALNETFSRTSFFDSMQSQNEYHFRSASGTAATLHDCGRLQAVKDSNACETLKEAQQRQNCYLLSSDGGSVLHARAHSSPAKISNMPLFTPCSNPHVKIEPNQNYQYLSSGSSNVPNNTVLSESQTTVFNSRGDFQRMQIPSDQNKFSTQMSNVLVPDSMPSSSSHSPSNIYHQLVPEISKDSSAANNNNNNNNNSLDYAVCSMPNGWEMAYNDDGKIYFVDHNTKSTTWYDPRLPREMQSAWGHTAAEMSQLHSEFAECSAAYHKLNSLSAQKEMLRRQLEFATRNEYLMRQQVYTIHGMLPEEQMQSASAARSRHAAAAAAPAAVVAAAAVDHQHQRQESSDSGLAPEPVVTPPLIDFNNSRSSSSCIEPMDASVDCLLSTLKESDFLLADFDMQAFRQDFQESI